MLQPHFLRLRMWYGLLEVNNSRSSFVWQRVRAYFSTEMGSPRWPTVLRRRGLGVAGRWESDSQVFCQRNWVHGCSDFFFFSSSFFFFLLSSFFFLLSSFFFLLSSFFFLRRLHSSCRACAFAHGRRQDSMYIVACCDVPRCRVPSTALKGSRTAPLLAEETDERRSPASRLRNASCW